ncbi:MAG TPA: hypothetical protein VFT95_05980, partial [Micromonosporaceae bacterium]|nr:hypothetical protein [Micromonosporaceae bacterium]
MAAPRPTASDGQPRITALARQRRHAVGFLDEIRSFSPVFLDTDVDMTAVQRHRAAARRDGKRFALV